MMVKSNPLQPRERFDTEKLNQLASSIKQVGLVQPIIVEKKDGVYQIISGERRWKAHSKAKLNKVLSLVKKYDKDLQKKKELLAANQHRENLQDFEEWKYIRDIARAEGWVHEDSERRYIKNDLDLQSVQANLGIDINRLKMLKATFEGTDIELQKAVKSELKKKGENYGKDSIAKALDVSPTTIVNWLGGNLLTPMSPFSRKLVPMFDRYMLQESEINHNFR